MKKSAKKWECLKAGYRADAVFSGDTVSLETPVGDEDGSNLGDFVADDSNASTEEKAESVF